MQITDTAGKRVSEGLVKITISHIEGTLGEFDKDIKSLANTAKSAMNPNAYFQMKLKDINHEKGTGSLEMFVQKSELKDAFNALSFKIGKWNTQGYTDANGDFVKTHEGSYDIKAEDIRYIKSFITLHGQQAQKRGASEIADVAGGQLIPSPTPSKPDRFQMLLPVPSDITQNDKDWIKQRKETVFAGSLKLSKDALRKQQLDEEEELTKKQLADVRRDKRERDRASAKNAKEIQHMEAMDAREKATVAKAVSKAFEDEEKQKKRDEAKALKEKEREDKRNLTEQRRYEKLFFNEEQREIAKKKKEEERRDTTWQLTQRKSRAVADHEQARIVADRKRENTTQAVAEAKSKEKNRIALERKRADTLHEIQGKALLISAGIVTLVDITRRILSSVLNFSTEQLGQTIDANSVSVSIDDARKYKYFETAKGLQSGTTLNSVKEFQSAFGDVKALDENKLKIIAPVVGPDVEKMVRSGLGGENPAKLMEVTFDAFFKNFQEGKNSLGITVGQESARRELITVLEKMSPNLARIFSVATYQYTEGINRNFSTWKEFLGTAPKNVVAGFDMLAVNTLGETINGVKAHVETLRDKVITTLSVSLAGLADKVDNIRFGNKELTNLELNKENKIKNQEAYNQWKNTSKIEEKALADHLAKYGKTLPVIKYGKDGKIFEGYEIRDLYTFLWRNNDVEGYNALAGYLEATQRAHDAKKEIDKNVYTDTIAYNATALSENTYEANVESRRAEGFKRAIKDIDEEGNTYNTRIMYGLEADEIKQLQQRIYGGEEESGKAFFTSEGKLTKEAKKEKGRKELLAGLAEIIEDENGNNMSVNVLASWLQRSGADPVTLLGGKNEDIVLKALGEYYGSKNANSGKVVKTFENIKYEETQTDAGYSSFAKSSVAKSDFAMKALSDSSKTVTVVTKDKETKVIVNSYVNGKFAGSTEAVAFSSPNLEDNSYTFDSNFNLMNGQVTGQ